MSTIMMIAGSVWFGLALLFTLGVAMAAKRQPVNSATTLTRSAPSGASSPASPLIRGSLATAQ